MGKLCLPRPDADGPDARKPRRGGAESSAHNRQESEAVFSRGNAVGMAGLADEGVARLDIEALSVEDARAVAVKDEVELFVAVVEMLADNGKRLKLEAAYELDVALVIFDKVLIHLRLAFSAPDVLPVHRLDIVFPDDHPASGIRDSTNFKFKI